MNKKIVLVLLAIFLIASGVGLVQRQTYTNVTGKENWREHFNVALFPSELSDMAIEQLRTELPNSNYILRVRATGEVEFMYGTFHQHVEVLEVYRGENVVVGDEIELHDYSWFMSTDKTEHGYRSANVSFVNFLVEDDEYLVFLDSKLDHKFIGDDKVFQFSKYNSVPAIFNYEDKDHAFPPSVSEYWSSVPLEAVQGNEFFLENEEMLEDWTDLKHELLEMFPRN